MLYTDTLSEIVQNINTGVEYEIALFYKLAPMVEKQDIMDAIDRRTDREKVKSIIGITDADLIYDALQARGLEMYDVSFETQNDGVGPSDIVMYVKDANGNNTRIGLSVKYANKCTSNITGRKFITETQISALKTQLPLYTNEFIKEMSSKHGSVSNWFRNRLTSSVNDAFIDLIRDAVIENWSNVADKSALLSSLFHDDSPIEFWVVTYGKKGYSLATVPETIEKSRADEVVVEKYQTSYIAFYLDGVRIARMQVKFNNGFLEKCKKQNADVTHEGVRMAYGQPFSSWNFSVER